MTEAEILKKYKLPKRTMCLNLQKWDVGNPLFITGISGSGKSTLARKLAKQFDATLISSDTVILRMKWSKERFDHHNTNRVEEIPVLFNPVIMEYIEEYNPNLPTNTIKKGMRVTAKDLDREHIYAGDFLHWVTHVEKTREEWKTKKVIVEGTYPLHAPAEVRGYPIIALGTHPAKCFLNRIKRKYKNGCRLIIAIGKVIDDYISFEYHFGKIMRDFLRLI